MNKSAKCTYNHLMRLLAIVTCSAALLAASCSGSDGSADEALSPDGQEQALDTPGVRVLPADEALTVQANPPADLVVLDVRTAEEFADGHLEGAVMLDFYDPDFAAQIAELDPGVPYLLYCRSGNRSGQTAEIMEQLGFSDVSDVEGGILAWADAGQPIVTE